VAKLPEPDPARLAATPAEYAEIRDVLWRLHSPHHPDHPMRWDETRTYGPLTTARFDPWLPPPKERAPEGVAYFGRDVPTCVAEVFQDTRHVSTSRRGLQLTAFVPSRTLRLLDLRGSWPISIGASHLINSGPRRRCRAWAHALRNAHPDADGLIFTGMAGRDCVTVFDPPGGLFPEAPEFSRPFSDPALASRIADACSQIGYALD
jgi:RES domain-containing protein